MLIPAAFALVVGEGEHLPLAVVGRPLSRGVLELTEPQQSFVFTSVTERPVLSLNRGFSAPIKLTVPIGADDLLRFLAAHDSDAFNRWQAIQSLAMTLLLSNVVALRSGEEPRLDDGLMNALETVLKDRTFEPAFVPLTLSTPSDADIARETGPAPAP